MSNLPMVPTGPSPRDVAEMKRLRNIMEGGANVPAATGPINAHYSGGYAGTRQPLRESSQPIYSPTYGTTADDVNAMKKILERFHAAAGDEVINESAPVNAQNHHPMIQNNSTPVGGFSVLSVIKESTNGKVRNSYDVVDANRQTVIDYIHLVETATAIMKYLNKGMNVQSAKVQELLDLEETYNINRLETSKLKKHYTRSIELGERAAAEVFKNRHSVARANAMMAHDQIKSILESIR